CFSSRSLAEAWMIRNQLLRRNTRKQGDCYYWGRIYNMLRHQGVSATSGQSDQKLTTAELIGREADFSEKKVRRCGQFATMLDRIHELVGQGFRNRVLAGTIKISCEQVVMLASMEPDQQREVVAKLVKNGRWITEEKGKTRQT